MAKAKRIPRGTDYGGEESVSIVPVEDQPQDVGNEDKTETEPHRNRTCNLLVKRDDPRMLLNNSKVDSGSNSHKFSPGYYAVYYLIPYGVIKFVGKNIIIYRIDR